jgi:hypothetical protein
MDFVRNVLFKSDVGCALTFASEVNLKRKFRFASKRKKSLISHDSLRCETPNIRSENEGKISEN